MEHKLPTETINKILNYLSAQPYSSVSALIEEIKAKASLIEESLEKKDSE